MGLLQQIFDLASSYMSKNEPPALTPRPAPPAPDAPAPAPKAIDWAKLKAVAQAQLGALYVFGSKPPISDPKIKTTDCSGFVRWVYGQFGFQVPEGSEEQFEASDPVPQGEQRIGDIGFFRKPGQPTHHVGILLDDGTVIEARGIEASLEAEGLSDDQVITRPQSKWEAFSEFTGWRRLRVVSGAK